jgi:hypothetical protein
MFSLFPLERNQKYSEAALNKAKEENLNLIKYVNEQVFPLFSEVYDEMITPAALLHTQLKGNTGKVISLLKSGEKDSDDLKKRFGAFCPRLSDSILSVSDNYSLLSKILVSPYFNDQINKGLMEEMRSFNDETRKDLVLHLQVHMDLLDLSDCGIKSGLREKLENHLSIVETQIRGERRTNKRNSFSSEGLGKGPA